MKKEKNYIIISFVLISFLSCGKNLRYTTSLITDYYNASDIRICDVPFDEWHRMEILYVFDSNQNINSWNSSEKKNQFEALCREYQDTCYNREIDWEYMSVGAAVQRTARIDVASDRDFDVAHPAGSSLNDLVMFYGATPYPCIASGYKEFFNRFDTLPHPTDNPVYNCSKNYYVHSPNEPKPFFPVYKRLSNMTEEDFLLTRGNGSGTAGVLFFTSKPEEEQTHTLTVTLTTTEGEQFSDEVVYTF